MLRIGDVAQATGLTPRAIRYYEELGLLTPALHASGANRRYQQLDIDRLLLIKRLREDAGLSLADIQTYLELEDARQLVKSEYAATSDPAAQLALLNRAEPVIRRRMAMLQRKMQALADLHAEDHAILERIERLRQQHLSQLSLAGAVG